MPRKIYDYIIAGAGCAGLSLAMHMIRSGQFKDKKILLIDREPKNRNDRTWCFWETDPGLFEALVCRHWNNVWFHSEDVSRLMHLAPYQYKMIRGLDFYKYCFDIIYGQSNFELHFGEIEAIETGPQSAWVESNGQKFEAHYIFNSIQLKRPELKKHEYHLLQHFKGWMIETPEPTFSPGEATIMDFRVSQEKGTTFAYILPLTQRKALVEYTLFTESLLESSQYDEGLNTYIREKLSIDQFRIEEEEFGIIPMTNYRFPSSKGRIIYLGTAGGQTKPSSGYTFKFIQKHSAAIVEQLINTGEPLVTDSASRFHFYDSVFLDILQQGKIPGDEIFTRLFMKNSPQNVLRFLDNESSIAEEMKIIASLPTLPFLKSSVRNW